ncbi:hypothetical protein [Thalassotalea sediminis]|uniref:hypothetical protein n=1 Tax=Thalassotalea sediminis TaxID=1759089 RepID=UPI0025722D48|nr:hypothetical protein [Thalassotalea sediminis]
MRKYIFLIGVLFSLSLYAKQATDDDAIGLSTSEFPWQLVIDNGKIMGCIYNNKYYSLGSILITEFLPRKCTLNSAREGVWSKLTETELVAFEEARREAENKNKAGGSTAIGNQALSKDEAIIIRMIRRQINKHVSKQNRPDN